MTLWQTTLYLSHANGTAKSQKVYIRRGICQGDSLSPLLFCIALISFIQELNNANYRYKIKEDKFNHLFYMDDLELFAKDDMCP